MAFVAVLACGTGAVWAGVGVAATHASATNPRKSQCLFMPTSLSWLRNREALARSPGSDEILKCRRAHPALSVIDGASAGPMSSSVFKLKPSLRLRKGCNISARRLPTSRGAAKSAVIWCTPVVARTQSGRQPVAPLRTVLCAAEVAGLWGQGVILCLRDMPESPILCDAGGLSSNPE